MSKHDYRPCSCGDVTDANTRLTCRQCGKPLPPRYVPTGRQTLDALHEARERIFCTAGKRHEFGGSTFAPVDDCTCRDCTAARAADVAIAAAKAKAMRSNPDRLFPLLLAACRDAIECAEKEHLDCQRAAARLNAEADPLPPWVAPMKRLLADASADPEDDDASRNNFLLSDDDRTKLKESDR